MTKIIKCEKGTQKSSEEDWREGGGGLSEKTNEKKTIELRSYRDQIRKSRNYMKIMSVMRLRQSNVRGLTHLCWVKVHKGLN